MPDTLEKLALHVKGRLIGDGSVAIRALSHIEAAKPDEIVFAEDERHLQQALQSKAGAIIVHAAITDLKGRAGIGVANPKLAFALLLQHFHPEQKASGSVHPSAVVGKDCAIGKPVDIRANVFVGDRVRIGKGTILEPGVYIGDDVVIGEDCWIGPNTAVYHHTQIGSRVRIHGGCVLGGDGFGYVFHEGHYVKIPQVGIVILEDDVELGCNTCVDRATLGATVVGLGSKVDNMVQIAHNDVIGKHVILSGQIGMAGSVQVGSYSVLGGKVGIVDHVVVSERTRAGAASILTRTYPPGTTLYGYPARPEREAREIIAASGRLPVMRRRLKELEERVLALEAQLSKANK